MDERDSLTNPGFKRKSITLYLWWGLNVAIVVFVFLAFLMSTLSYTHSKDISEQINNTVINQQGGLIQKTYTVAPAFTVKQATVTSFCGHDNMQICEGLGPIWHRPFTTDSWSPAISAELVALTQATSLYFHVVEADHNTLRVSYVDTSANVGASFKKSATITLPSPVTSIHAVHTNNPNVGVVMYTTHNETYLHAVTVTTGATPDVKFAATSVDLFPIHSPTENGTLHRNLAYAENWVLVTSGYEEEGANYLAWVVDTNQATGLRSVGVLHMNNFGITIREGITTQYLGNGYIVQSNANHVVLGKMDFNALSFQPAGAIDLPVHFAYSTITRIGETFLLIIGTQYDFVEEPLHLSLFVEWGEEAPTLKAHSVTNLLGTQNHRIARGQISVAYVPPTPQEPYGGIFFTYIEDRSNRAKIVRARAVYTGFDMHLLPSVSLDISSHRYGRFHGPFQYLASPRIVAPVATTNGGMLIVLQDFASTFNNFEWAGGYRYAGISTSTGLEETNIDVVRAGISSSHQRLIPGFHYYVWNNGTIAPYTSTHELFTSNGFSQHIGTAVTNTQLHLELDIFDRMW